MSERKNPRKNEGDRLKENGTAKQEAEILREKVKEQRDTEEAQNAKAKN